MRDREDIVTELRAFGTNGYMMRAADEIELLRAERDAARRIAAYQYAKHHNGDEDTLVKNFFAFRGWDYSGDTPPTTVPAQATAEGFFQLDRKQLETDRLKGEVRKLQNQVEDYRECFADLAKNRDELWDDLERVTGERDAARQTAAYLWARSAGGGDAIPTKTALREFYASKGWSLPQENGHE